MPGISFSDAHRETQQFYRDRNQRVRDTTRRATIQDERVSSKVAGNTLSTHPNVQRVYNVSPESDMLTLAKLPAGERRYEAMVYFPSTGQELRLNIFAPDVATLTRRIETTFGPTAELAGWGPATIGGAMPGERPHARAIHPDNLGVNPMGDK